MTHQEIAEQALIEYRLSNGKLDHTIITKMKQAIEDAKEADWLVFLRP